MTFVQVFEEKDIQDQSQRDSVFERISNRINKEAEFQKMDVKSIQWFPNDLKGATKVQAVVIFERPLESSLSSVIDLASTLKELNQFISNKLK